MHQLRKTAYDKFQITDNDGYRIIQSQSFLFQQMIQSSIMYIIISLQILASCMKRQYRSSAKWVILFVLSFLIIDADLVISNTDKPDLLDRVFP